MVPYKFHVQIQCHIYTERCRYCQNDPACVAWTQLDATTGYAYRSLPLSLSLCLSVSLSL
eukprot:COSAG03_NODE_4395_length_1567_cov_2.883515_1_plen_59_part_10